MRLTKFFSGKTTAIDEDINKWIQKSPKQRSIIQIVPYKKGVLVLYEEKPYREGDWESIKKDFMKKTTKAVP